MAQEPCSHALPLRGSRDIRVAHQGDISFVLDPDHPQQASFLLATQKTTPSAISFRNSSAGM